MDVVPVEFHVGDNRQTENPEIARFQKIIRILRALPDPDHRCIQALKGIVKPDHKLISTGYSSSQLAAVIDDNRFFCVRPAKEPYPVSKKNSFLTVNRAQVHILLYKQRILLTVDFLVKGKPAFLRTKRRFSCKDQLFHILLRKSLTFPALQHLFFAGKCNHAVLHVRQCLLNQLCKAFSEIPGIPDIILPDFQNLSIFQSAMKHRSHKRQRHHTEKEQNPYTHLPSSFPCTANRTVLSHFTPLPVMMSTTASQKPREMFHI